MIIGYRADDSYFSFSRSFVENSISLRQLGQTMRNLGEAFDYAVNDCGLTLREFSILFVTGKYMQNSFRRVIQDLLRDYPGPTCHGSHF